MIRLVSYVHIEMILLLAQSYKYGNLHADVFKPKFRCKISQLCWLWLRVDIGGS